MSALVWTHTHSMDTQDGAIPTLSAAILSTTSTGQGSAEAYPAVLSEERFFLGLRLMEGIQPSPEEYRRFAKPIEKWLEAGYLVREGSRLRLSRSGILISNEIFQDFVESKPAA